MRLSASQIANLAAAAGFAGDDLTTAVAVALAESNVPATTPATGNTDAYNPEIQAGTPTGLGSVGLWQIYEKVHPEFVSWDLRDPQTNANAAFLVYSRAGQSFRPWSTFKSGAYLARMNLAQAGVLADAQGSGPGQIPDGGIVPGPAGSGPP